MDSFWTAKACTEVLVAAGDGVTVGVRVGVRVEVAARVGVVVTVEALVG